MSNRAMIALGVVVALVAGGYVALRLSRKPPEPPKPTMLYPDLRAQDIHRVRIYAGGREAEAIELAREAGDRWRMPSRYNHRVDSSKVTELFTKLGTLRGEARGRSPARHAELQVDDARAVHLVFLGAAGDERLYLFLGKQGPDYSSCFVRRKGDDVVYVASENLRSLLGMWGEEAAPDVKRWLDLEIVKFDPAKVVEVTFDGPARRLRFERYEEQEPPPAEQEAPPAPPKKWRLLEPELTYLVREGTMTQWLSSLSNPRAEDVLDPAGDHGLDPPPWRILLKLEEDRTVEIRLGREREGEKRPVQVAGEPSVFLAGKWAIPLRRATELLEVPTVELGRWQIQRIEILDPNKEIAVEPGQDGFDSLSGKWTRIENFDIVQGVEEAAMGLGQAAYRLRLHTEEGVKELAVGDVVPQRGGSRYAKWSEAERPWIVEKSWLEQRFPAWGTVVTTLRTPAIDRAKVAHVHVIHGGIEADFDVASRGVQVLGYRFEPRGPWEEAVWKAAEGWPVYDLATRAATGDVQATLSFEGEASGTIQVHAAAPEGGGRYVRSGESVWLVREGDFDTWLAPAAGGWILKLPEFAGTTKVTSGEAVLEGDAASAYAGALLAAEAADLSAEEVEWTQRVTLEGAHGAKLEIDVGAQRDERVPVRAAGAAGVLWYAAGTLPAWPN